MLALKEYLPQYTYEDYKEWEGQWELIWGIAYSMSPSPNITHQELNANIIHELKNKIAHCKHCKVVPEIDWKIDEETVVRPDTSVICNIGSSKQFLSQKPNIIFEILSPSTKRKDRDLKYHLYQDNRVDYYIIVEPAGMFAEVYRLYKDKYRLEGELTTQSYTFHLEDCEIEFSFKDIFDL
ncbi:MAG: hypothetical protein KU38_06415 [Sulfurovum sp. FS08-3]|nr:MAG: hypothetical protein KU38_06415 [Sulfurovum sp. FS08-3]